MELIKENKYPIITALVIWVIMVGLRVDRLFFVYEISSMSFSKLGIYVIVKIFFAIMLLFFCILISNAFKGVKSGSIVWKRAVIIFSIYFSIELLLLFILWPGTWAADDIALFQKIKFYEIFSTEQHYLTHYYQMVLLQFFPCPGGLIFMQLLVFAVIVAYVIESLEVSLRLTERIVNHKYLTIIELIPFLLPPVILYNFSGFRSSPYTYCELLFFVILVKNYYKKISWNFGKLASFALLLAVVVTWRSEGIIYLILGLGIIFSKEFCACKTKQKIAYCILSIILVFGIRTTQQKYFGNDRYLIMQIANTVVVAVNNANMEDPIEVECVSKIGKVVNLDLIYENPERKGVSLIWDENFILDSTNAEYSEFKAATLKLAMKHIPEVVQERIEVALETSTINGKTSNDIVYATSTLFDDNAGMWGNYFQNMDAKFNKPISTQFRKNVINFLGCVNEEDTPYWIYHIIWEPFIPLLIIMASFIYFMVKRNSFFSILAFFTLLKNAMIFASMPNSHYMYFEPMYLIGYVLIIEFVLWHKKN